MKEEIGSRLVLMEDGLVPYFTMLDYVTLVRKQGSLREPELATNLSLISYNIRAYFMIVRRAMAVKKVKKVMFYPLLARHVTATLSGKEDSRRPSRALSCIHIYLATLAISRGAVRFLRRDEKLFAVRVSFKLSVFTGFLFQHRYL